ncbi:hypothetical protein [Micromonospora sp. NPDC048947]|uniref:hypothetical protein n=1 Tax=Micromonospora sp. NPDC048947 TaxID=3154826 RepID=UPI00341096AD
MTTLHPGDIVRIGLACSVQFTGNRVLRLRLVAVGEPDPYNDWIWLTGYVLGPKGNATDKREVYVQRAGVVVVEGVPRPTLSTRNPHAQPHPRRTRVRTV